METKVSLNRSESWTTSVVVQLVKPLNARIAINRRRGSSFLRRFFFFDDLEFFSDFMDCSFLHDLILCNDFSDSNDRRISGFSQSEKRQKLQTMHIERRIKKKPHLRLYQIRLSRLELFALFDT